MHLISKKVCISNFLFQISHSLQKFSKFVSLLFQAKALFDEAALDIETELIKTSRSGLTYIAEHKYGRIEDKMDHLACFAGQLEYFKQLFEKTFKILIIK